MSTREAMMRAELQEAVELLQRALEGLTPALRAEIDDFLQVPRDCGVVRRSATTDNVSPAPWRKLES